MSSVCVVPYAHKRLNKKRSRALLVIGYMIRVVLVFSIDIIEATTNEKKIIANKGSEQQAEPAAGL